MGGGRLAEGVGAPPESPQAPPADGPAQPAAPQQDPAPQADPEPQGDPEPDPAADDASPLGSAPALGALGAPLPSNQPSLLAAGAAVGDEFVSGRLKYRVTSLPPVDGRGKAAVVANGYQDIAYEIPRFVHYEGAEYAVAEIAPRAFSGCKALVSVSFPEGLEALGDYAFSGCTSLASAALPASLESMGKGAFNSCKALVSVSLPEGLKAVGDYAFSDCTSLATVSLPASLESIGKGAFNNCKVLESAALPAGLRALGDHAFSGCAALKSAALPAGLKAVGAYAFSDCTSLASAAFPVGLQSIGAGAFKGCTSLASAAFPAGLEALGANAFQNCTSLATAAFPEGLGSIGNNAFDGCTALKEATLLKGLKSIGGNAFKGCTSLASAAFPEGLGSIGDNAFNGCTALKEATLPVGLKTIGDGAFADCTSLASATFPEGLETIGGLAFKGCTSLASASLPKSLDTIENLAFSGCTSLVATFKGGTPKIEEYAFYNVLRVVVDGGSVAGAAGLAKAQNPPTDSQGRSVYLATVTFRLSDGEDVPLAPLVELEDAAGKKVPYGLDLASTDGEGRAYLWLPEGTSVARAATGDGTAVGTRTYSRKGGGALEVAAHNDNRALFTADQVDLRVELIGEAPSEAAPSFVDGDGNPVVRAKKGQRVGLDVSALEGGGLRVAGLYLATSARGGGPRPGPFEIEDAFTRDEAGGGAVYRFDAPASTAVVYCVVAPAGGADPSPEPRVLTDSLPGAARGEPYDYRIAAQGPAGTAVSIAGLPLGLEAEGLRISGVPQATGSFEVKVALGADPVARKLVLEVGPGELRSASDNAGNRVTGFVPEGTELVVKESPFGLGNMQAVAGELGWRAVEAGPGGTFRATDASGDPATLEPLLVNKASLVLNGEELAFSGDLEATFAVQGAEPPAGYAAGARASIIAAHVPADGGTQVAVSESFPLGELAGRAAGGIALAGAAGGMAGSFSAWAGGAALNLKAVRGLSPFALYLKVEGAPAPVKVGDAAKPLARTGDAAPWAPAALAAASGALLLAAALRRRRER